MSDADNEKKRGGVLNKEQHYVPYYPISFSLVETFLQHPIGSLGKGHWTTSLFDHLMAHLCMCACHSGVFGTMSVLAGGLYSMLRGDSALKSNAMMRNRVLAQLATVGHL